MGHKDMEGVGCTAPGRCIAAAPAALAWGAATVPEACKASCTDLQRRAVIHDSGVSLTCLLSMARPPLTFRRRQSMHLGLERFVPTDC